MKQNIDWDTISIFAMEIRDLKETQMDQRLKDHLEEYAVDYILKELGLMPFEGKVAKPKKDKS